MKVIFSNSFYKDIKKIKNKKLKKEIENLILKLIEIKNIIGIDNLKKMTGYENYFRIKLSNYRMGLKTENNHIKILRFLHRKDIYKYFP